MLNLRISGIKHYAFVVFFPVFLCMYASSSFVQRAVLEMGEFKGQQHSPSTTRGNNGEAGTDNEDDDDDVE